MKTRSLAAKSKIISTSVINSMSSSQITKIIIQQKNHNSTIALNPTGSSSKIITIEFISNHNTIAIRFPVPYQQHVNALLELLLSSNLRNQIEKPQLCSTREIDEVSHQLCNNECTNSSERKEKAQVISHSALLIRYQKCKFHNGKYAQCLYPEYPKSEKDQRKGFELKEHHGHAIASIETEEEGDAHKPAILEDGWFNPVFLELSHHGKGKEIT